MNFNHLKEFPINGQEMRNWCWAACTEMVSRHTMNQCNLLKSIKAADTCSNFDEKGKLRFNNTRVFHSKKIKNVGINFDWLMAEIDAGGPMVFLWDYTDGTGNHYQVVIGYFRFNDNGRTAKYLIVADPLNGGKGEIKVIPYDAYVGPSPVGRTVYNLADSTFGFRLKDMPASHTNIPIVVPHEPSYPVRSTAREAEEVIINELSHILVPEVYSLFGLDGVNDFGQVFLKQVTGVPTLDNKSIQSSKEYFDFIEAIKKEDARNRFYLLGQKSDGRSTVHQYLIHLIQDVHDSFWKLKEMKLATKDYVSFGNTELASKNFRSYFIGASGLLLRVNFTDNNPPFSLIDIVSGGEPIVEMSFSEMKETINELTSFKLKP